MDKQYRTYGDDRYDHLRSRVLRGFFSSSLLKEVFGSQKFSAHAKLLCVYICTSLIRHQGRQFLVGQFSPYLSPNNPHTHTKKLDLFVTFFFFSLFFWSSRQPRRQQRRQAHRYLKVCQLCSSGTFGELSFLFFFLKSYLRSWTDGRISRWVPSSM